MRKIHPTLLSGLRGLWSLLTALLWAALLAWVSGKAYSYISVARRGMTAHQASEDYGLMAQTLVVMGAAFLVSLVGITLWRLATSKDPRYTLRTGGGSTHQD